MENIRILLKHGHIPSGMIMFPNEYPYTRWEYRYSSMNIFILAGNTDIPQRISIYALPPYTFPHCNNPFHPQISGSMTKISIPLGRILPSRMLILYYTFSSVLSNRCAFPPQPWNRILPIFITSGLTFSTGSTTSHSFPIRSTLSGAQNSICR